LTGIPRAEFEIFKYAFQRLAKGKKINFCTYCAEKGFVELAEDPIFNVKNYYQSDLIENVKNIQLFNRSSKNAFSIFKKLSNSISKRVHTFQIYLNRTKYPFKDGNYLYQLG